MRIRKQPAVAFAILVVFSGFLGLAPSTLPDTGVPQSDKVLHFVDFFLLTACFYWIIDTNKRKVLQLTVLICTVGLGVGSEVLQGLLPNGRNFDIFDIVANLFGSGAGIAACLWYHKRMIDRKRKARGLQPGDGEDLDLDLELGEQETGVTHESLEEELDNWDENAQDWDDDDPTATETGGEETTTTPPPPPKKRDD